MYPLRRPSLITHHDHHTDKKKCEHRDKGGHGGRNHHIWVALNGYMIERNIRIFSVNKTRALRQEKLLRPAKPAQEMGDIRWIDLAQS